MTRDAFESPRFLIDQTQVDFAELTALNQSVFERVKYSNHRETDPITGNWTLYCRLDFEIPDRARAIAFNAITNLRSSMDQCLVSAVRSLTDRQPSKHLYFPLGSNDRAHMRSRLGREVPEEIVEAVESLEPWPTGAGDAGGNDLLCAFSKLSRDKHNVVCGLEARFSSYRNGRFVADGLVKSFMPPPWNAETQQFTIGTFWPNSKVEFELQAVPFIALREARTFSGKPATETIESLIAEARRVLLSLEERTNTVLKARS